MRSTPDRLNWVRSSYCSDGTCVEVAVDGDEVLVRNNQQPDNVVRFTRREWEAFRAGMADGEF